MPQLYVQLFGLQNPLMRIARGRYPHQIADLQAEELYVQLFGLQNPLSDACN